MARPLLRTPGEYTDVSAATEIKIPWLTWLSLMFFCPLLVLFSWSIGWLFWLQDAKKTRGLRFGSWYRREWFPWADMWWPMIMVTIVLAWGVATIITAYRMWTEQGAKQWKAEWGWWYPGKTVPVEAPRE